MLKRSWPALELSASVTRIGTIAGTSGSKVASQTPGWKREKVQLLRDEQPVMVNKCPPTDNGSTCVFTLLGGWASGPYDTRQGPLEARR